MMKKMILPLLSLWAAGIPAFAQAAPIERIYVSTDRDIYVAGDLVWCSLFCLTENGRISPFSAVAYLELISDDGTAAEAKTGLLEGRGAGAFRIPASTPTGTYRLVAYTAQNTNEDNAPWLPGSRLLTVFNTTSTVRVKGGADILDAEAYEALERPENAVCGDLQLSLPARLKRGASTFLTLRNNGAAADFSLSVFHEDGLVPAAQENTLATFLEALPGSAVPAVRTTRLPEYDGEIITATLRGDFEPGDGDPSVATLSCAGSPSNLYIGRTVSDQVRFFTTNIYGDREIVCEVSRLDLKDGYIDFESPFIHPAAGTLPKLRLSPALQGDLEARKAALYAEKALRLDTLASFLRHREDLLLESSAFVRYHLDDYNRFPTTREVLTEIIPALRFKKDHGKWILQMVVQDASDNRRFRVDNILVMMDGVVLTDLQPLIDFDAMLLEDIDLYPQAVTCGMIVFNGVVNFITKKNYVTALPFPSNVRVTDFKGVSWPVAYTGEAPRDEGSDLRQVLYWHPAVKLEGGTEQRISLHLPGYLGRFRIVAEGLAADGTPLRAETTFEVE